jgi:BirA family biotin operon repressor/biotin-[acetyl-CoA-carboxylase] ligase
VAGIGINVNNSLNRAPEEVRARAIAMCDTGGRCIDRNELLIRFLQEFELTLSGLVDGSLSLREMWTRACMLQGRQVSVQAGGQITTGRCEGIDDDGNLLIRSVAGLVRCSTGIIARIE